MKHPSNYLNSHFNIQNIELIKVEDDEVLFAVAEELGKIFPLINDKTVFLPSLESLAK